MVRAHSEGLKIARLLMVLASMSPLFILWAIRGSSLIPDTYFVIICIIMIVIPNGFLYHRIKTSKRNCETQVVVIGSASDHRDHFLVYLFAMLLPFLTIDLGTWRGFAATLVAIGFVVLLFYYLNLHYMNIFFAVFGFRVYTIYPPADANPLSGREPVILISRQAFLTPGDDIDTHRLSDTIFIEVKQ